MRSWLKYIAGLLGILLVGSATYYGATLQTLSPDLLLKTAPENIISARVEPAYSYIDETGQTVTAPAVEIYSYLDKPLPALPNEDISQRTAAQMVFKLKGEVSIDLDAGAARAQAADGSWMTVSEARTTPEAFAAQTLSYRLPRAILATLGLHARADCSFCTSGAGSGNQTWSVPADWNNANNNIQCIGAGGNGAAAASSNGGAGGGGGEYRKITNVTLSGTATYNIGAGVASTTNERLAETYFNGTASTTASLSCGHGFPAVTTTHGAGGTGGTGATANFDGGAGGDSSLSDGGGGGGGSAGPTGIGKIGATPVAGPINRGGGGGGGSNAGSATDGSNGGTNTAGGDGGDGTGGSGHGVGSTAFPTTGTDGTTGGGGGGGLGQTSGTNGSTAGGNGGMDTAFDASHGASGGGGGGGSTSGGSGSGGNGGNGGTYGGGGAGGGRFRTSGSNGTGGTGGQGIIIITYTPAGGGGGTGPTPPQPLPDLWL